MYSCLALLVAVVGTGATDRAAAQTIDAFTCYKARDLKQPKFAPTSLTTVDDQFTAATNVTVKKPSLLCSPVSVGGAGIAHPADHLVCYKSDKSTPDSDVRVEVTNVFGTVQLLVKPSTILCAASSAVELPRPGAGEFVALTYNVAGLPEGISGSHPEANTPIIGPLLNAYDLVLLQESWKTPDPNPLAPLRVYHEILEAASTQPFRSVAAPQPLGTDPFRPSALVSDGLNRFSRFRFDDVTRQPWAACWETSADCLALKGFSMARTTLPGGAPVDVYNLHMEAGGAPQDDQLRDDGVTQLVAFILANSAGRALIVGGDFNLHTLTEPDATQFARLLAEAGLTDACAALSCPDPGRIDKILFRNSAAVTLTPQSWRLESDVFVDGDDAPLSDHLPVAVRFAWQAPGTP